MSQNWINDIEEMHNHYGVKPKVENLTPEMLKSFLEFRVKFLIEELTELQDAVNAQPFDSSAAEETVDALIDLCVVAIGTLDLFGINSEKAWNEVHEANMNKCVGIKESRPNPFGLPDLVKPPGWKAPSHADNHGLLSKIK